MSEQLIWAFWGVSMSMVWTPGADWAYTISAKMQRAVLPALVGMLCGHFLVTLMVMAGVGAIVASSPELLTGLTWFGAAYLAWLGWQTLRQPANVQWQSQQPTPWQQWLLKGVAVSGFNPKVLLMFLALLPQFIQPTAALPATWQIGVLGSVHLLNCALVYPLVALGVGVLLHRRPQWAKRISFVSGSMMIGLAVLLVVG